MDLIFLPWTALKILVFPGNYSWVILLICAILYRMELFGLMRILEKAGRKKWKAFVPVLNTLEVYDMTWNKKYAAFRIVFGVTMAILSFQQERILSNFFEGIMIIFCFIVSYGIHSVMKLKLARSFYANSAITYGLITMEAVFYFILGISKSSYLGPCIGNDAALKKLFIKNEKSAIPKRIYMINLYKRRSKIALAAGIMVMAFNFYAISTGLLNQYAIKMNDPSFAMFHYFTVNSALFSSIGAGFMIPYALEGIRKKRFVFPKWITLFQFAGAICTTMTMIFSIFFIFPTQGVEMAFGGPNFWMHTVCPLLSLVLLFSVEIDRTLSKKDVFICMIPFIVYSFFYIYNAILLGEELGGWRDFYMFVAWIPAAFSLPMVYVFFFFIAFGVRHIYNYVSRKRAQAFMDSLDDNLSEIEINIEVYGIGRYNGHHSDHLDITIPFDIFNMIAKKYNLSVEKLSAIYTKGVIDGIKEPYHRYNRLEIFFDEFIGYPYA